MKIAVLKYNAGNFRSLSFAMKRLGYEVDWTDEPETLNQADRVIIPGVGAAEPAMKYLKERNLDRVIKELTQPVLGICVGMQLFCEWSEEEDTGCLGIFPIKVNRFVKPKKIPHMGWNTLEDIRSPLLSGLNGGEAVYFVHSYCAEVNKDFTIATSHHGESFSAALSKDNFYATQFHTEKSGRVGEEILRNFLTL